MRNRVLENKIQLYSLLINQIQKYNTIFWQFPTILSVANLVSIVQLKDYPPLLLGLSLLNLPLIFAFYKMRVRQKTIINRAKAAEKDLLSYREYSEYIPEFSEAKPEAPKIVLLTLSIMDIILLVYSITRIGLLDCLYLLLWLYL